MASILIKTACIKSTKSLLPVLPPVLVPRNPQVISSRYEPVPSYLDTQRASYSPMNDLYPLNFEAPGLFATSLQRILSNKWSSGQSLIKLRFCWGTLAVIANGQSMAYAMVVTCDAID